VRIVVWPIRKGTLGPDHFVVLFFLLPFSLLQIPLTVWVDKWGFMEMGSSDRTVNSKKRLPSFSALGVPFSGRRRKSQEEFSPHSSSVLHSVQRKC